MLFQVPKYNMAFVHVIFLERNLVMQVNSD